MAGGGFKGGQVVGATDARGEEVKARPVNPNDVIASVYALLGIDAQASQLQPPGSDATAAPSNGAAANLLKEIL